MIDSASRKSPIGQCNEKASQCFPVNSFGHVGYTAHSLLNWAVSLFALYK